NRKFHRKSPKNNFSLFCSWVIIGTYLGRYSSFTRKMLGKVKNFDEYISFFIIEQAVYAACAAKAWPQIILDKLVQNYAVQIPTLCMYVPTYVCMFY
ncbi:hypothetical protein WDU94_013920, partial [Cyamophila willieti]